MAETCEDCGRPITHAPLVFQNQWEPGKHEVCYPRVNFGGEQLCAERTVERLRAQLTAATARAELYRRGYEARGEILAAYRIGRRPSDKALDAASEVATELASPPQKKPTDEGGRCEEPTAKRRSK